MIELTIVCGFLAVLVGFVLWLWREDKNHCHANKTEEAKRLYKFLDDMYDRIASNNIEQYAMTYRIKRDIAVQTINAPREPSDEKQELPFVHQKR